MTGKKNKWMKWFQPLYLAIVTALGMDVLLNNSKAYATYYVELLLALPIMLGQCGCAQSSTVKMHHPSSLNTTSFMQIVVSDIRAQHISAYSHITVIEHSHRWFTAIVSARAGLSPPILFATAPTNFRHVGGPCR